MYINTPLRLEGKRSPRIKKPSNKKQTDTGIIMYLLGNKQEHPPQGKGEANQKSFNTEKGIIRGQGESHGRRG